MGIGGGGEGGNDETGRCIRLFCSCIHGSASPRGRTHVRSSKHMAIVSSIDDAWPKQAPCGSSPSDAHSIDGTYARLPSRSMEATISASLPVMADSFPMDPERDSRGLQKAMLTPRLSLMPGDHGSFKSLTHHRCCRGAVSHSSVVQNWQKPPPLSLSAKQLSQSGWQHPAAHAAPSPIPQDITTASLAALAPC